MKLSTLLALSATTGALASSVLQQEPLMGEVLRQETEQFLVELAPDETVWVTEEEKWTLKRVSQQHEKRRGILQ